MTTFDFFTEMYFDLLETLNPWTLLVMENRIYSCRPDLPSSRVSSVLDWILQENLAKL